MKLKILILLFPILLFGQNRKDDLEKKKIIDSRIRYIDSIANFTPEEIKTNIITVLHGKQPERETFTSTNILKESGQVLRICYRIRRYKTDDDFSFYYLNSKLIYGELTIWNKKNRKLSNKKFYYENELPIYPSYIYSRFNKDDIDAHVKILNQSEESLKQASS